MVDICVVSWAVVTDATSHQLEEAHLQEGVGIIYHGPNTSSGQLILATGAGEVSGHGVRWGTGCFSWVLS